MRWSEIHKRIDRIEARIKAKIDSARVGVKFDELMMKLFGREALQRIIDTWGDPKTIQEQDTFDLRGHLLERMKGNTDLA